MAKLESMGDVDVAISRVKRARWSALRAAHTAASSLLIDEDVIITSRDEEDEELAWAIAESMEAAPRPISLRSSTDLDPPSYAPCASTPLPTAAVPSRNMVLAMSAQRAQQRQDMFDNSAAGRAANASIRRAQHRPDQSRNKDTAKDWLS